MTTNAESKTVLLLVDQWRRGGGLETVTMDIAWAFKSLGCRVVVVSVFGAADEASPCPDELLSLCPRGRVRRFLWGRYRWKSAVAARVQSRLRAGDLLIVGHAHRLPVLDHLPEKADYGRWAWLYGLEVWGAQARRWVPALNRLDRVLAISRYTAGQVREAGLRKPVQVVSCCVDTEVFTPTTTPDRIRRDEILICGRMSSKDRDKGHAILFESLPLAETILGRKLSVRVAGAGDDPSRLAKAACRYGVRDRVTFAGYLPKEQLVDAYRHCGVFCMPTRIDKSATGYWNGEGFGIVYVEAAACGRPVLASREGGASETIIPGKTGLLVDPRSPDSVAHAVAEILRNPLCADQMGREGRQLAEERFSRPVFRDKIRRLLQATNPSPNGAPQ